jgi:phosphonate transport system substrate-binding protein
MEHLRLRPLPLVRALLIGLCALGMICIGSGCGLPPDAEEQRGVVASKPAGVLRVGVQTWDMPSRVDEAFAPIEQAFEGVLMLHGLDLSVEIEPFAVYKELLAALAEGRVDVARLEPGSYLTARHRQPGIAVLAVERPGRGGPRQGVIVTGTHSSIDGLAGLRGKSFAFGDEHASLGHHLAQAKLLEAGLRASDLRRTQFLRRSDKVAAAVRLGEFDAGVLEAGAFRRLNTDGGLRVLASLVDAPRPWIARVGLEPGVTAALSDALLRLTDVRCLQLLDASGFERADEKSYELVRAAMAATVLFQSLRPQSGSSPARPRR